MTNDATDIAQLMGNLEVHDELRRTTPGHETLHAATAQLGRQAEATVARAERVQNVIYGSQSPTVHDHAELFSLMHDCDKLALVARTVSQTIMDNVVASIPSLRRANKTQKNILAHFRSELDNVVRKGLSGGGDGGALWMIVEECFTQSIRSNGALHSDSYYDLISEAGPELPYDPDFESEEYYEHENRLTVDENYAEAFYQNCERMEKEKRKRNSE